MITLSPIRKTLYIPHTGLYIKRKEKDFLNNSSWTLVLEKQDCVHVHIGLKKSTCPQLKIFSIYSSCYILMACRENHKNDNSSREGERMNMLVFVWFFFFLHYLLRSCCYKPAPRLEQNWTLVESTLRTSRSNQHISSKISASHITQLFKETQLAIVAEEQELTHHWRSATRVQIRQLWDKPIEEEAGKRLLIACHTETPGLQIVNLITN